MDGIERERQRRIVRGDGRFVLFGDSLSPPKALRPTPHLLYPTFRTSIGTLCSIYTVSCSLYI